MIKDLGTIDLLQALAFVLYLRLRAAWRRWLIAYAVKRLGRHP